MQFKVLGWRYENLRGGLRKVNIDLETRPSRFVLLQMPNGLGKTTTMSLFRAAFSGETLTPEFVRGLRASDTTSEGSFEVRVAVDEKPYRIVLKFNFNDGTCQCHTVRAQARGGGLEMGRALPSDLKRLFTPDFTRLFVFDGELAKEIRAVGKDRAAMAIRTLYRLDRLDALNLQIARLVSEKQQQAAVVSSASEQKGLTRWQRSLETAQGKKKELLAEQRRLETRQKKLQDRRQQLTTQISARIAQDDSLKKRQEELDSERGTLELGISELANLGLAALRIPAKIHPKVLERLRALGEKLTRMKLPKTISAEFFNELAEQEKCVCGTAIDAKLKQAILTRAGNYLAEDQILVINKMKLALRESSASTTEYTTLTTSLNGRLRDLARNNAAHDQLELERVEAGDAELERLRHEARENDHEQREIGDKLELITTRDPLRQTLLHATDQTNLPLCELEVKRCGEKLATATDTVRFVRQSERVKELVSAFSSLALDRLRERVRNATNDKLAQLVKSESLRVARIGGALELASSGLQNKGGVSEGQSLAVAYAFLTSLLAEAPYQLPFIVDSPAVSLDLAVRREVGELIPKLFQQMIMFVISGEREGFADAFYSRRGVRYITLQRADDEVTEVREGLQAFQAFQQTEAA